MRKWLSWALLCAAVACAQTSSAPITAGLIQGMVIDPAGAVISGAQVTATEESTARVYAAKTGDAGQYQFAALAPGKYTVRCEMPSFKSETKTSVVVGAGQVAQLNFQLAVGAYEDFRGPGPAIFATATKTVVVVNSPDLTRLDIRLAVGSYSGPEITPAERVEVCTASCPLQLFTPSPPHQGFALQIHAESNVVNAGSSLWLTVILSNTTDHPIFIHSEPGLAPAFGYQITALGGCGCPRRLYQRDVASSESKLRIPPGGSLTDRIDLSRLMDLSQAATYTIFAERPDTSNAVNYSEGIKDAPLVTSNSINVRVLAPY